MSDRIEGAEKIGILAAELMESIEEADVDQGLEATIGTVAVVVELTIDDPDGPGWTEIRYRCSDSRRWLQRGFFEGAQQAVDHVEGDA